MKVGEMITLLKSYPRDMEVLITSGLEIGPGDYDDLDYYKVHSIDDSGPQIESGVDTVGIFYIR